MSPDKTTDTTDPGDAGPGTGLAAARRVPLYEQAAAMLEAEIRSGRLGADDRLLSERALAERLHTSRITIRRALAHLAEKDLVRPSTRSGWFTGRVSEGTDVLTSFSDLGRQRGFTVSARVLRCEARDATLGEAEELGLAPGSEVLDLARIRYFNDLAIATTSAVIPTYLAPGIQAQDFSAASLYDVLRGEFGVIPTRGECTIEAAACGPAEAAHLGLAPGGPVLIFAQTGYDTLGRAFELSRTVYRADRYLFRATVVAAGERGTVLEETAPRPPAGAGPGRPGPGRADVPGY
jgi:GntR family transcriptional regulator